uniref:Uncharacterized protein n=1 Tax=Oryza brachyantha TaxID=4533 RepID=J3MQV9_ORYBR
MAALEQFLPCVPLPDCADPDLRKSEGDLFLCRGARKRPPVPFREDVASSLRPPWRADDAYRRKLGWDVEHGWSSCKRRIDQHSQKTFCKNMV